MAVSATLSQQQKIKPGVSVSPVQTISISQMSTLPNARDLKINLHPDIKTMMIRRRETEAIRTLWRHINKQKNAAGHGSARAKSTGDLERRGTVRKCQVDREISSAKFYTALTRRAAKQTDKPESFDALTTRSCPLPSLFDCPDTRREFPKRNVRFWEDEVKKVVPDRPKFSIPYDIKTNAKMYDWDKHYHKSTASMFVRSSKRAPPRHYTINQEWLSEEKHLEDIQRKRSASYAWG